MGNVGGRVWAAGYGINEKNSGFFGWGAKESSDYRLRTRRFQISKPIDTQIANITDISNSFLIDSIRDTDDGGICSGDSGGPIFRGANNEIVIGVISRGTSDCYSTGVATRVFDFQNWIKNQVKEWETDLF